MKTASLNLIIADSQASRILDSFRFLSAFTVFLFHFYVPLPGYQAVMIFFVLSGYFISSTVLRTVSEDRWSWTDYLLKRVTRLWIVLLPALVLTFVWAKLQLGLFGEELSPPNLRISNYLGWEMFFGNLLFLQGILVKPFGLNGPLWSLSYEFWYYIMFPCLVLAVRSRNRTKQALYGLLFVVTATAVGQEIMKYFLIWLFGAIIPFLRSVSIQKAYLKNILVGLTGLLVAASMQYEAGSSFLLDARVGLLFSLLTYLVVSFFNQKPKTANINLPKHFAGFSYTLYLTHYPLANLILTWRISPLWPFQGNPLLVKASLALLVFGYAWVTGLLTERHTDRVRKFIVHSLLSLKSKPKAAAELP